jgi:hypothetical protein
MKVVDLNAAHALAKAGYICNMDTTTKLKLPAPGTALPDVTVTDSEDNVIKPQTYLIDEKGDVILDLKALEKFGFNRLLDEAT